MVLTKLKSMTLEQTVKIVNEMFLCPVKPLNVNAANFLFQFVAELQSFTFDFFFVTFTSKN